ncbi:MAG: DUF6173 family protein [Paracoccaceae bacterium]|nr:DUF6173 family protein [Paracoccaceae bacterium]MDG2258833.1 DUF6173 family protein [Paracoccaceae bacterium]
MTQKSENPISNSALKPAMHECHTDPGKPKASDQELAKVVSDQPVEVKSAARWAYERLILYIKNFEEQLDNEHEVAMGFAGSDAGVLRIEGMGYFDPDIVTFYGTDPEGNKTQLVQHVTQLNVILRAVALAVVDEEPTRIGFRLAEDLDENAPAR